MTTALDRPAPASRSASSRRRFPLWFAGLAVLCVATLVYLLPAYIPPDMRASRVPETATFPYVLLLAHIYTASVALVAGALQFWPWLRRRHPAVHRWSGRVYLFAGVFPTAVLAIPVALQTPEFGVSNQLAICLFAVLWFGTAVAGYRAARRRGFGDHREWMIRNYAISLGKLTNMVCQPLVAIAVVSSSPNAPGSQLVHDIAGGTAWLAFTVNVVVAEWYLQRGRSARRRVARARSDP